MVWVNPPNRLALYLYHARSQSSMPPFYTMFNRDVDAALRKSLFFLLLSLVILVEAKEQE
jgi:hypothetical protein